MNGKWIAPLAVLARVAACGNQEVCDFMARDTAHVVVVAADGTSRIADGQLDPIDLQVSYRVPDGEAWGAWSPCSIDSNGDYARCGAGLEHIQIRASSGTQETEPVDVEVGRTEACGYVETADVTIAFD